MQLFENRMVIIIDRQHDAIAPLGGNRTHGCQSPAKPRVAPSHRVMRVGMRLRVRQSGSYITSAGTIEVDPRVRTDGMAV